MIAISAKEYTNNFATKYTQNCDKGKAQWDERNQKTTYFY